MKSVDYKELWPVLMLTTTGRGWNDDEMPPQEFTAEDLADYNRMVRHFNEWQERLLRWPGLERMIPASIEEAGSAVAAGDAAKAAADSEAG